MKKAIMSFGVGSHERYIAISRPIFQDYADRHGYDYLEPVFVDFGRPPSWCKVAAILEVLDDYDLIQWIDADVVIVDSSEDISAKIPAYAIQAVVVHHTEDGEVPNFGVWTVKNKAKEFLEILWQQEQHINAPWWEQTAALELMGYASTKRPCKLISPTEWYDKTFFLPLEWNSHPWDEAKNPRFRHATMHADIEDKMKAWASQAKR